MLDVQLLQYAGFLSYFFFNSHNLKLSPKKFSGRKPDAVSNTWLTPQVEGFFSASHSKRTVCFTYWELGISLIVTSFQRDLVLWPTALSAQGGFVSAWLAMTWLHCGFSASSLTQINKKALPQTEAFMVWLLLTPQHPQTETVTLLIYPYSLGAKARTKNRAAEIEHFGQGGCAIWYSVEWCNNVVSIGRNAEFAVGGGDTYRCKAKIETSVNS